MTPLLAQRSRADRQFERIYERHAGDVYRYALAVLRNPADAEDVTQTTFLNAYRAYAKGDRPETPRNWLIAIAHNVCRQRFRQAARRPNEVELNEDLAESFVPEETIAVEDIQRALGHLAFNQRAALVMRELEGRSYAEIADILEVSVAAVETLIFRARRALREQLEGSLTCSDAERSISRQLDGVLPRAEKAQLRGHLRECKSCSSIARRMRAQKGAWKALAVIPLPGSLTGLFGGSSASVATGAGLLGGGIAVKTAAVVATAAVATGTVYEGKKLVVDHAPKKAAPALAAAASTKTATRSAKSLAPGQVKPAGEHAVRPAVPPGRAKKALAAPNLKPQKTPVGRVEAPGQVKKATTAAASTRGKSAAAPGRTATKKAKAGPVRFRTKKPRPRPSRAKKPDKVPANAQKPTPGAEPPTAEPPTAEPSSGNGNGKAGDNPNAGGGNTNAGSDANGGNAGSENTKK